LKTAAQEAIAGTLAGTMPAAKGGSMTSKTKSKAPKKAAATATTAGKSAAKNTVAKPAKTAASARAGSKLDILIGLLRRPKGAGIAELMKATGWQAHSIRGAISGGIRKKLGHKVASTRTEDGQRVYRIGS
jgi:hypothetical protein